MNQEGNASLFFRALKKLYRCSWADRGLLLEAACWLALARLAVLTIPFKRIAPHLGTTGAHSAEQVAPETAAAARRVGWAVRAVARRTPWDSNCLAQAIAAKRMLRRRRIPSTLYLGVARPVPEAGGLSAHAWLRCGAEILTGGRGHALYTVLSTFAEESGSA